MAMGDHNGIDITEMMAPALQLSRYGRQRFLAMNATVNKGQIPLFPYYRCSDNVCDTMQLEEYR